MQRKSDGKTLDIGVLAPGGYADAPSQDAFCLNTRCVITIIYDQSAQHNDMTVEGPGSGIRTPDIPAPADGLPVTAGGHQVYGISFTSGMGYRDDNTTGIATNNQPEGMYMVTSGTHFNGLCCFDYGNAETNNTAAGDGHMDAINFSNECWFSQCPGSGPWVQADLENGLFLSNFGGSQNQVDRSRTEPFVTAMLKNNGQNFFALRSANAQSGSVRTDYAGPEPAGYSPMHLEGAVVLGTGGDNGNLTQGSFFEGAMTAGLPSDAVENAVQASIARVGYGGSTGTYGSLTPGSEISILRHSGGLSTYLLHSNNAGQQMIISEKLSSSSAAADRLAATWIVRRGLANNACVSFESRDRPGEFIRHANYVLYSQPFDGTDGNAADATFCPVAPLDGQTTLTQTASASTSVQAVLGQSNSFQSFNFPDRYLRIYFSQGYIGAPTGTAKIQDGGNTFRADASFAVTTPLAP